MTLLLYRFCFCSCLISELLERRIQKSWSAGPRRLEYFGRAFDDEERNASTPSAVFSLVATMVGGGVLSLPSAGTPRSPLPVFVWIRVFWVVTKYLVDFSRTH